MTLARRLDRLHARSRYWRTPTAPALDFSALSPEEQYEVFCILEKLEGAPPRADGRPDLSSLTDDELERLYEFVERITIKETP